MRGARDTLACPAIAVACLEAVAVEEAGNQIVAGNQHQLTHGLDDIGRGAVALPAPALGQAQLAVGATHPVDDEHDLGGRVDIGHDLVDQGAHDALLQPCIGRRHRPDSLQIGGERRKCRWISARHRPCSVVGGNLAFHLRGMGKRLVPARFQFGRYKTVCRVSGIVLPEGPVGGIARRLKIATESIAHLIPPFSGFLGGSGCSSDRAWADNAKQCFLDCIIDAQSAEANAVRAAVVHPGAAAAVARASCRSTGV